MSLKKKRIIMISAIALAALMLICCVVMYFVGVSIYKGSFDYRCETSAEDAFDISEFPTMKRERHTFKSNNEQTLVGYLYENADELSEKTGVIVFAHGLGGGGQTGYMDIFDIMTRAGYYVFAYDATANDESEGEVVGGLPQGYIDLDHAISYAQTIEEIKDLPFALMGYSWGGLSVTNVLNYHPEVKAVVSLAGWNKSMNLIDYRGCQMVGGVAKMLLPFASLYEFLEYGKYSFSTSMKGFKNSDCAVMIVHSDDDTTIPIEFGYETYIKKYENDERFTFKKYTGRDHALLTLEDETLDVALFEEIVEFFDAHVK